MGNLGLSFAETFFPERIYLSKLLELISKTKDKISVEEVSERTGIPQGSSSGKVSSHLRYLKGMGLIADEDGWYRITGFGKTVLTNDKNFGEFITQWLCHAFLCDKKEGACLYEKVFSSILPGKVYRRSQFDSFCTSKPPITALLGMYLNKSSFAGARILVAGSDDSVIFHSAPIIMEMLPAYGALIAHIFNEYFQNRLHISIDEFSSETGLNNYMGWIGKDLVSVIERLSAEGYTKIEANVNPIVFSVLREENKCWEMIYNNLI